VSASRRPRRRAAAIIVASAAVVLSAVACGAEERPAGSSASGAALYATACASCHGADLAGRPGIADAIPPGLSEMQLRAVIVNGTGTMVGFPGLSPAEVDAIVAHVLAASTPAGD